MTRVYYKDGSGEIAAKPMAVDESSYNEPASVNITDDWDTVMEDFVDDFDDYQDVNFPASDDDI